MEKQITNLSEISWDAIDSLHNDIIEAKIRIYNPCGFLCSQPIKEKESAEYGAYSFELNGFSVKYRVAKITPTKAGLFVTLWKRMDNGPIMPYDILDPIDFFVISVRKDNHFGQFIFPKSILRDQDVLSMNTEGGKRAIRVYPPWDTALNRQAQKTQKWQMEHFLELSNDKQIDTAHAQMLYSINR